MFKRGIVLVSVLLMAGMVFAKSGFHGGYALENPGRKNNSGFYLGWHTEPTFVKYFGLDFHSNFAFSTFENPYNPKDDVYHFHTMLMLGPKVPITVGRLEPFVSIGGLFSFMTEVSDRDTDYFFGGGLFIKFGLDINITKKIGLGFEIEYDKPWGKKYDTFSLANTSGRITSTVRDLMAFGIRINY